jgi:hypothetical protein
METCFAESHGATVKHNVITIEKAMGMIKRYRQLTTVMAAKRERPRSAACRSVTSTSMYGEGLGN